MSASLAARPEQSTREGGAVAGGRRPPPEERGATLIPASVVARLTAQAAREALREQTDASSARPGLGVSRPEATVHQGSARIAVSLDLPYPVDIARACDEIEHYITERVSHLTGLRVGDTTVSVQRLVPDRSGQGRVS
ncbi:Asp23/Gls24 family envelope stress response protein [Streptomyces sp. V4-01]|uniref:Asp23/Gls24 family envelope stress response protein n=1 Tax=Actinacidiphila polyblastidii TaxID=3110430 RepID=A0ABU7PKH7_9ACTN|nr:Asp23/Gls24 family envelope stress response protein [Streptomyces sp. V4-01]